MKNFSKITALALALVLAVGCLASCDVQVVIPTPDVEEKDSYVANIKIKYVTEDDKMKDAVSDINSSSVLSVDGDRADIVTESAVGDTTVGERYTLDGGKLYHTTKISVGEFELCENEVAPVDRVDVAMILYNFGVGADISSSDFETVETGNSGKLNIYTCSDITDESRESLLNIFGQNLESIGGAASLDSVRYYAEEKDGQLQYSILSCGFSILLDGEIYEVTMHIDTTYDYEAEPNIVVPDNAADFTEVSYDEIIK